MPDPVFILPKWPAPPNVKSLQTTRAGGVSRAPWDSFNLGAHVGDAPEAVAQNRALLRAYLPAHPVWLEQVHGDRVFDLAAAPVPDNAPCADAAVCRERGQVCAVMTADCLPVLFCDDAGEVVAAAHAGWRGLLAGVLENTVAAMRVAPERILAWFGPAIGPTAFEIGAEVRAVFLARHDEAAFSPAAPGKYLANIYCLASQRLTALGVTRIFGGDFCTHTEAKRFFSYRREERTGRMASLIYLD